MNSPAESSRPTLGVSACLLGHEVRFDGGHKRDSFLTDIAPNFFDLVHFCPEMEIGLGKPRPVIQLRRIDGEARLVNSRDAAAGRIVDHTGAMRALAQRRAEQFQGLDGLVVKKGSPSCGMERVAVVINAEGYRERNGEGIFTAELRRLLPLAPIEEEGRLLDPLIREVFLERVFSLHRWRQIPDPEQNLAGFIEFHARHKLLLMARGPQLYAELGRIVAGVTRATLAERRERYIHRFMEVMAMRPDVKRQINVLMHILGFFKRDLDSADKKELLGVFEAYREGRLTLVSPLLLLRHHLRRFPNAWLESQYYLYPFPEALAPRSQI